MAFRPHPVGKMGETSQRYAASATSFLFAFIFFAGFYRSSGVCGSLTRRHVSPSKPLRPHVFYFCRSRNARSISRASSLALAEARLS